MTADPLPNVNRVRKARRSSVVACGHDVLVGQVIVGRAAGGPACTRSPPSIRLWPALAGSTEGDTMTSTTTEYTSRELAEYIHSTATAGTT